MDDPSTRDAAALIAGSRATVALTGAGISTESGIPDFRGTGGLWTRYDPDDFSYQRFVGSEESRRRYWAWSKEFYPRLRDAVPNAAHLALAALERAGRLACVVTQNIDGLHQRAGSREVIELHGNALSAACLVCRAPCSRDEIHARLVSGEQDPRCRVCGGVLKTRTVLFGEAMPPQETVRAFEAAEAADLLLVIGSSLVVHPAAQLVPAARRSGARVVLVNLEPTDYDAAADVVVHAKAAEAMRAIVALVPGVGDPG